jgi:hypothetical protein
MLPTPQEFDMPRKLALITVLALFGVMALGSLSAAQDTFEDPPDTAVSDEYSETQPPEPLATPIEPDPTVTNPRPHAWERIVVGTDGRTLDIYFWMGIEDCNGLHSVTVDPTDTGIDVLLLTGTPAGAEDMMCIELAQLYVTTIVLEQPLIGNAR